MSRSNRKTYRVFATSAIALFALFLVYQGFVVGGHKQKTYGLSPSSWTGPLDEKLRYWPPYQVARYLREETLKSALVLSLKPADMYYSGRKMVSYLDERLLPFYAESKPDVAIHHLVDLGITHIHVPDYSIPPMYNSALSAIISNPKFARLATAAGGNQIYELKVSSQSSLLTSSKEFQPGFGPWIHSQVTYLIGRSGIGSFQSTSKEFAGIVDREPELYGDFFEHQNLLVSGLEGQRDTWLEIEDGREYKLDFEFEGEALVSVFVFQYNEDGKVLSPYDPEGVSESLVLNWKNRVSELPVRGTSATQPLSYRFVSFAGAKWLRVAISYRDTKPLTVRRAVLRRLPRLDDR